MPKRRTPNSTTSEPHSPTLLSPTLSYIGNHTHPSATAHTLKVKQPHSPTVLSPTTGCSTARLAAAPAPAFLRPPCLLGVAHTATSRSPSAADSAKPALGANASTCTGSCRGEAPAGGPGQAGQSEAARRTRMHVICNSKACAANTASYSHLPKLFSSPNSRLCPYFRAAAGWGNTCTYDAITSCYCCSMLTGCPVSLLVRCCAAMSHTLRLLPPRMSLEPSAGQQRRNGAEQVLSSCVRFVCPTLHTHSGWLCSTVHKLLLQCRAQQCMHDKTSSGQMLHPPLAACLIACAALSLQCQPHQLIVLLL